MAFSRILLMTTLAFSSATQAAPMTDAPPSIEIDGVRARALAVAWTSFGEKLPDADGARYAVHLHPIDDGIVQVVFEPLPEPGAAPTLGGRTAAGRELNVWVDTADYSVERTAFAR